MSVCVPVRVTSQITERISTKFGTLGSTIEDVKNVYLVHRDSTYYPVT